MIIAVFKFIKTVSQALEDGWQPGQDIPEIVIAAFKDFWPILVAILQKNGVVKTP